MSGGVLVWWAEGEVRWCEVEEEEKVDDKDKDEWSILFRLTVGRARESLHVSL